MIRRLQRYLVRLVATHRTLILLSAGIFFVGVSIGIAFPLPQQDPQSMGGSFSIDVSHATMLGYFLNNSRIVLLLALGAFSLGAVSFFSLFFNGVILGVIIDTWYQEMSLQFILLALFPHGVFELPALWIAGAIGFKTPRDFLRYLFGDRESFFGRREMTEMVALVFISLAFVGVAAVIEAHVTPALLAARG